MAVINEVILMGRKYSYSKTGAYTEKNNVKLYTTRYTLRYYIATSGVYGGFMTQQHFFDLNTEEK